MSGRDGYQPSIVLEKAEGYPNR